MQQRISKVGEDEQVAEFGAAEVAAPDEAPASNGVNRDILNGLTDLVKRAAANSQSIAELFGITPSDLLALFKLDEVMTMKELAQHMNVDPSFVTTIADTLERRGLARREPSLRDRRMKNLVLTPEGIAARERMMQELALLMPWCYALDGKERHIFLALIRKMLAGPKNAKRPHRTARPRRVGQPRHPGG